MCPSFLVVSPEYSFDARYGGYFYGGYDTGIWLITRWYDTADDDGEETYTPSANEGFFDIPSGHFSGLEWYHVWHWCSEDSRLIAVLDYDKGAGYIDRTTGKMVIEPQHYCVDPANFHDPGSDAFAPPSQAAEPTKGRSRRIEDPPGMVRGGAPAEPLDICSTVCA